MNSMLRRIMHEMADANGQWEKANNRMGGEHPWTPQHLELLARAALLALAEPTPEMIAAVAPRVTPASPRDYELALEASSLLPRSDHPNVGDILAEISRDFTDMIAAAGGRQ